MNSMANVDKKIRTSTHESEIVSTPQQNPQNLNDSDCAIVGFNPLSTRL